MSNTPRKPGSWLFKVLVLFGAMIAAYFINVQVQTHLGAKARAATGLQSHAFDEALQIAQAERKPVLVELTAVWCPSCRALDKKVFRVPEVAAAIDKHYVFSLLDYESEAGEAFLERYELSGFPHLVLLRPDGTVQRELSITYDPADFLRQLVP